MSESFTTATGGLNRVYDAVEATIGAPHNMVRLAAWDALEEFCVRSTYWRELLDWDMAVGVTVQDLNPVDADIRVAWVLNICGLGHCYRIKPTAMLVDLGLGEVARSGTAYVVCKPSKLDAALPNWVQDWSEALRAGTLFRLLTQPGKPYADKALAQYYGKEWRSQINLARVEAKKLRECDAPRFPYFARGRGAWAGFASECCNTNSSGGGGGGVIPPTPGVPALAISIGVISTSTPPVTGPGAALSASTLTYGATVVTVTAAPQTIVVTNNGDAPLIITGASATGDFAVTGVT